MRQIIACYLVQIGRLAGSNRAIACNLKRQLKLHRQLRSRPSATGFQPAEAGFASAYAPVAATSVALFSLTCDCPTGSNCPDLAVKNKNSRPNFEQGAFRLFS